LRPFSALYYHNPVQYYATGGGLQIETSGQLLFTDEKLNRLFQDKFGYPSPGGGQFIV